jgi:hypothetical protein
VYGGDAEEGSECGMPGSPTVKAEDEFIEVGLEVLAAQPVIDAQGPDLEVGEDPVNPREHNVGGHLADDTATAGTWTAGSDIAVCSDKLINLDDEEEVDVNRLR